MMNAVVSGVSKALYEEFGDKVEIYTERVEQGIDKPFFIVLCQNPTIKRFLGTRFESRNPCVIQFSGGHKESNLKANDVLTRLFFCLNQIEIDGQLTNGYGIEAESDCIPLTFHVQYNFFFIQAPKKTYMEHLSQNQRKEVVTYGNQREGRNGGRYRGHSKHRKSLGEVQRERKQTQEIEEPTTEI